MIIYIRGPTCNVSLIMLWKLKMVFKMSGGKARKFRDTVFVTIHCLHNHDKNLLFIVYIRYQQSNYCIKSVVCTRCLVWTSPGYWPGGGTLTFPLTHFRRYLDITLQWPVVRYLDITLSRCRHLPHLFCYTLTTYRMISQTFIFSSGERSPLEAFCSILCNMMTEISPSGGGEI